MYAHINDIPEKLGATIFENLPPENAKLFRLALFKASPVGADLSMVWPQFALWILADPHHGVLRHCNNDTRPAVEAVIDLYRRWVGGEQPSAEEFEAAAWAAARAAEATWATGLARAAEAAEAAACAAWAVAGTAEAAGTATWETGPARVAEAATCAVWAGWSAGEGFWLAAHDELLRLLREAPVSGEAGL